jgi:hypothetical protein
MDRQRLQPVLRLPAADRRRPRRPVRVFGVAVLATVFAHRGVYESPQTFISHFSTAVWVGASFSAVGIVAALLTPRRPRPGQTGGQAQLARVPAGRT